MGLPLFFVFNSSRYRRGGWGSHWASNPDYPLHQKYKQETQKAALRYERAVSMHNAAREMVFVAEQGVMADKNRLDPTWQEMLNHATCKVRVLSAGSFHCSLLFLYSVLLPGPLPLQASPQPPALVSFKVDLSYACLAWPPVLPLFQFSLESLLSTPASSGWGRP